MHATQGTVQSADGTLIAFDRIGSGPPLVMIDPAGGYSGFDNIRRLGALLAAEFAVYTYDRRGRGGSGDTQPYGVEREVEDLGAVIAEAGGSAFVYGFSSGGLLALHGAAGGLPIDKMGLFEPPVRGEGEPPDSGFTAEIDDLVSSGRRAAAVHRFLSAIGVPSEMVAEIQPALDAVAHTLVYDCKISDATAFELLGAVHIPTLVLDSQASSDDLTGGSAAIVQALPNATRRSLAGEWHGVSDEALAPVLAEFFRS